MDFSIPNDLSRDLERFKAFLKERVVPNLAVWYREGALPRAFHSELGRDGWFGYWYETGKMFKHPPLRGTLLAEAFAVISPGVTVAALAHNDLGLTGLWLFGSERLKAKYAKGAVEGKILICLGNTESGAGSDVAGISCRAKKTQGGWLLNGTKAYVTNGLVSDTAVVSAVSDPEGHRNRRLSLFLVDLSTEGVSRKKLDKQVWIPSDLTRLVFKNVFVPEDHLLGEPGRGLQQVLTIFTHSRVPISALTLGTAVGAFETALEHAGKRRIFGREIRGFQAKAFEIADLYAKIEAARLLLWKACWTQERNQDFRLESSLAKYTAVSTARELTTWATDLFGAASVIRDHPIHKFPMDAWAASLGEGTQDVQKLIIYREVIKRFAEKSDQASAITG